MNAIVNAAAYSQGRRVATIKMDEIDEVLQKENTFVWLGLHEPDENLLRKVQTAFHLHDLAVEDAHSAHQRPKLETYGDTLFIALRTAQVNPKNHRIDFGETHFFLHSNFIVTIRHGSSLAYTEVRAYCESTPDLLSKGPGFALYAVMDSIVDQYFPVIEALEGELVMWKKKYLVRSPAVKPQNAFMD